MLDVRPHAHPLVNYPVAVSYPHFPICAVTCSFFGGTMRRIPPAAMVWGIDCPSCFISTAQNKFLCDPVAHLGSTATSKAISWSSLLNTRSGAVTFSGRPDNRIIALPSNGLPIHGEFGGLAWLDP